MPYVKFVKTKTKAEALASNDSGAIYFPTDANTIIMENKEYGINSYGPSDNDNSGIPEAPIDGKPYNRKDGEWVEASGESTVFQGEFNPDECLTPGVYSYVKGELVNKDPDTQYVLSVSEDKTQKASPMNDIGYCYIRYYNGESDSEDDPFEMYRPVGEPIELDVFSAIGQQFNANDNLHFYYEYDEDTVIESEYCVLEVFRCDRFILPDDETIYAIFDIVGFSEDAGVPIITPKAVLVEYGGEYMLMDTSNIGTPADSVVLHPDGATSVTVTKDTAAMLAQQFDEYLQMFNGESAFTRWEYCDTGSSEPTGDYVTRDELNEYVTNNELNEYVEQVTNGFSNVYEYIDGIEGMEEAPQDGNKYARQDGEWTELPSDIATSDDVQSVLNQSHDYTTSKTENLQQQVNGILSTLDRNSADNVLYSKIDTEFVGVGMRNNYDHATLTIPPHNLIIYKTTIKPQYTQNTSWYYNKVDFWDILSNGDDVYLTARDVLFDWYRNHDHDYIEAYSNHIQIDDWLESDDGEWYIDSPRIDKFYNTTVDTELDSMERMWYISVPTTATGSYPQKLIACAYMDSNNNVYYYDFKTLEELFIYKYQVDCEGELKYFTIDMHSFFDYRIRTCDQLMADCFGEYYIAQKMRPDSLGYPYKNDELLCNTVYFLPDDSSNWSAIRLSRGEAISDVYFTGTYGIDGNWFIASNDNENNLEKHWYIEDYYVFESRDDAKRIFSYDPTCTGHEWLALRDCAIYVNQSLTKLITVFSYSESIFNNIITSTNAVKNGVWRYNLIDANDWNQMQSIGARHDLCPMFFAGNRYSNDVKVVNIRNSWHEVFKIEIPSFGLCEYKYIIVDHSRSYIEATIDLKKSETGSSQFECIVRNSRNEIVDDIIDISVMNYDSPLTVTELIDIVEKAFNSESIGVSKNINIKDLAFGNGYFNNDYIHSYEIYLQQEIETLGGIYTVKYTQGNHKYFFVKDVEGSAIQIRMDYLYAQLNDSPEYQNVYVILSEYNTKVELGAFISEFKGQSLAYLHGIIQNNQYQINEMYEMKGAGPYSGLLDHSGDKSLLTNLVDSEGEIRNIDVQKLKRMVIRQLDPIVDFDTI